MTLWRRIAGRSGAKKPSVQRGDDPGNSHSATGSRVDRCDRRRGIGSGAGGGGISARVGPARRGYRQGTRERTLTTSLGPTTFAMRRARVRTAEGATAEWRSEVVPRYQRRSERVDEAILGVYLSGTNTRRIKGALAPLLRGGPLSKDAVSRLVGRLSGDFQAWSERDLAAEEICYLTQDGWYPKLRIGKRRVVVPVLVTLGVKKNGER